MAYGFVTGTINMGDGQARNFIGSGVAVTLLVLNLPGFVRKGANALQLVSNSEGLGGKERVEKGGILLLQTAWAGALTYAAVRYLQRPYGG